MLQIQPNLVNLAAPPIPPRAYIPSSPLTGFSSASPRQESSSMLSHTINPPSGFNANCIQGPHASCSTPLSETNSQVDNNSLRGSTASSEEEPIIKMQHKKHRKRKYFDEDGSNDSHSKQAKL